MVPASRDQVLEMHVFRSVFRSFVCRRYHEKLFSVVLVSSRITECFVQSRQIRSKPRSLLGNFRTASQLNQPVDVYRSLVVSIYIVPGPAGDAHPLPLGLGTLSPLIRRLLDGLYKTFNTVHTRTMCVYTNETNLLFVRYQATWPANWPTRPCLYGL